MTFAVFEELRCQQVSFAVKFAPLVLKGVLHVQIASESPASF